MGGFCLLVELHREGSAPAACAAGLLHNQLKVFRRFKYEDVDDFDTVDYNKQLAIFFLARSV